MTIVKYSSKIMYSYNAFSKRKSIWIELKKCDELTDSISHWIPVFVKSFAVIENITS